MSTSRITLVVSDLDGTLLEPDGRMLSAVGRIREVLASHQAEFTIATGRSASLAGQWVAHLGISLPYIAANGATIVQDGTVLATTPIRLLPLRPALEQCLNREYTVVFTISGREYALRETPWLKRQRRRTDHDYGLWEPSPDDWASLQVEKVMVVDDALTGHLAGVEHGVRSTTDYTVTRYNDKAIEIVAAGCSKGAALTTLAAAAGHSLATTLAIGDHQNDLELLTTAGLSAAPGNAIPAVREAAGYVATASHGAGVLEILHHFLGAHWA